MQLVEGFYDTCEIRLHYMEGPDAGPPLVLLHGAISNWRSWSSVLPHLVKSWHVYVLELRGHGLSGRAAGSAGYHITHNVADLSAFLSERVAHPTVVWGHSWGAVVSFLSGGPAREHLRALVLEDPPLNLRRKNSESQNYLDFFSWVLGLKNAYPAWEDFLTAARESANFIPPEMIPMLAEGWYQVDLTYARMLVEDSGNIRGVQWAKAARAIACPALLLQADPEMGAALVEKDIQFVLQRNPVVQLVRFKDVGHGIHDRKTAEMLEVFDAFCRKI